MKILTLAQHDKHQTSDSQAICRRRSTLLPFLPGLRTNKLEAASRICIQQTLRQGALFSNKKKSATSWVPTFFFLGGGLVWGRSFYQFLAEILDDFLPSCWGCRFWPRLFDLQPREPGNCPPGLPSAFDILDSLDHLDVAVKITC